MAKKQASSENEATSEQKQELKEKLSTYEKLLDELKKERAHVEQELRKDYKEARRYVRSHPEEGVLLSFVGGIVLGILIGKMTK